MNYFIIFLMHCACSFSYYNKNLNKNKIKNNLFPDYSQTNNNSYTNSTNITKNLYKIYEKTLKTPIY